MNNVNLIGNLVRDPDVRYNQDQMAIARFTIAINDGKDKVDYPQIVCFGKIAEVCEKYLTKGVRVGVSGRLHTSSYKNKDGVMVYSTDVVANQVDFLSHKEKEDTSNKFEEIPEDLPF